jgi:hypothetical protein
MGRLRRFGLFRRLVQSITAGKGKKHGACKAYLEACPDCSSTVQRERQYLERLRNAAVPAAPDDLVARLLARTEDLALAAQEPISRPRPRVKVVQLLLACAAATAGLMGMAAFVVGGDPAPQPGTATAGTTAAGTTAAGTGVAGSLTGQGGTLSASQIQELRGRGWSCPDLSGAGFHLVWAKASVFWGEPVMELRLSDGKNYATILEQHPATSATSPGPATAAREPVNVLTGHAASEDGFSQAANRGGQDGGSLWVYSGTPQRAIYQVPGTTLTYVSDLPEQRAEAALAALTNAASGSSFTGSAAGPAAGSSAGPSTGSGTLEDGAKSEDVMDRLQRGMARIFGGIITS